MINSRFISFEGGEGSGKSTQIKLLAKKLSKKRKVIITREPGGTKEAEKIRNLIVKDKIRNGLAQLKQCYFLLREKTT